MEEKIKKEKMFIDWKEKYQELKEEYDWLFKQFQTLKKATFYGNKN